MPDYFALLELPRSPWLESEQVKEHFVRLSAPIHPDHVHQADTSFRKAANEQYAELNAAQRCLSDVSARLRHLLELEGKELPADVGSPPMAISDLFFSIGKALRTADGLLQQKSEGNSPMLRAQLMRNSLPILAALRELISDLERREKELDDRCKSLAERWGQKARPIDDLVELLREYGFLRRWLVQLRERSVRLTF